MFWWTKRRRRARWREEGLPEELRALLTRNVPYYRDLPEADRHELEGHVQVLLHEKYFEGCRGLTMTDEVRVTIAGHAACLLLHREPDYFPRLKSILVYPSTFLVRDDFPEPDGTVLIGDDPHAGQSWDVGAVVLAWDEVLLSAERDAEAYNVVIHEFAHQLDFEDRHVDGTPRLHDPALHRRWVEVMTEHFDQLGRDIDHDRHTLIDPYGSSEPAEFFAVATETFFELPRLLRDRHPELYGILRDYFRQDPASLLEN